MTQETHLIWDDDLGAYREARPEDMTVYERRVGEAIDQIDSSLDEFDERLADIVPLHPPPPEDPAARAERRDAMFDAFVVGIAAFVRHYVARLGPLITEITVNEELVWQEPRPVLHTRPVKRRRRRRKGWAKTKASKAAKKGTKASKVKRKRPVRKPRSRRPRRKPRNRRP